MKMTYICSPCRGDYEKNIIKAQEYCREALLEGLLPIAPHVYFTQFVDDEKPEERERGLFLRAPAPQILPAYKSLRLPRECWHV